MKKIDRDELALLKEVFCNLITITGIILLILGVIFIRISGYQNEVIFIYTLGLSIFIFGISFGYNNKSIKDQKELKNDIKLIRQKLGIESLNPIPELKPAEPDFPKSEQSQTDLLINIRDLLCESNQYSKNTSRSNLFLSIVAAIIALNALGITAYGVNPNFYQYSLVILALVVIEIAIVGFLVWFKK
jgi:hypothetical protein